MNHSHLLVASILAFAAAAAACDTRPDIDGTSLGAVHGTSAKDAGTAGDDDDDDDNTAPVTKPKPGTSSSSSGAPAPPVDAGPPPITDAFTGAPAFAELTPATDTQNHHLGDTNSGKDCLECHGTGNGAPTFAFAGTVRATAGQADGATGVQVRIVDPSGAEVGLVGTDSEGNFWLLGAKTIPPGSHVAIRSGSAEKKMSGTIGAGSCNTAGCHDPTRPIFLGAASGT